MHVNLGAVLRVVSVVVGTIVPAVSHVEQLAAAFKGMKGKAKQDAVVDLVRTALTGAEGLTGKDLLNDPDVEAATRAVVDATVALQNLIARQHAAAGA